VAQSNKGITLCQRNNCLGLLKDTGMLGSKLASTPMDVSLRLQQEDGSPHIDAASYKRLIRRLLYLATSTPDITFVVQQLSQFMTNPT
jgi:hypothetical protein